jgi:multiple sugar transport system permease protein
MQDVTRSNVRKQALADLRAEWLSINTLIGYAFVLPLILWLAATILYPLFVSIHLSTQNIKVIGSPGRYVGLDNYDRILSSPGFLEALKNSAVWVVGNALVQTVLAFAVALILKQRFIGHRIARI